MKYHYLSIIERYQIQAGISLGMPITAIAQMLSRHRSTIFRELKRSGRITREGYIGHLAQQDYAWNRKTCRPKFKISGTLKNMIDARLTLQWSPEQISGRLKREGHPSACPETIYRYIYQDKKAGGTLWKNLRHCRARRKKRFPLPKWPSNIQRPQASERPIIINQRLRKGDFERDTIVGAGRSGYLLTFVDRKTKLLRLVQPESIRNRDVHRATIKALGNPNLELKSITNDNGVEFIKHEATTKVLKVPIYFTRPYASWERGTIENTNGLIRQYFHKKTDLKGIKHEKIKMVEALLNQRPRKTLDFKTPLEAHFDGHLHKINLSNVALDFRIRQ